MSERPSLDELWAALSEADGEAPPTALGTRVLDAALARRVAGRPSLDVPAITPVEAFAAQVEAFDEILAALTPADWGREALRGLDVQGLVGHLVGVEDGFQAALDAARLGGGEPPAGWRGDSDHIASTQPFALAQRGRAPGATHAEWRDAGFRSLARLRALDPAAMTVPVTLHGLRLPLGGMLVVRTFELWTHDEDIRRATARPAAAPGPSTLRLMTGLAAGLLAAAVERSGRPGPGGTARIVLTGAAGGAWTVRVAPDADGPARVRIVADAVDFCRLAAARLQPVELAAAIDGDPDLAARVLAGARSLALD